MTTKTQTARQVSALASSTREKRTGNGLNSTSQFTTPAPRSQASPKLSQKWIQFYEELERRYIESRSMPIEAHRARLSANVLKTRGPARSVVTVEGGEL